LRPGAGGKEVQRLLNHRFSEVLATPAFEVVSGTDHESETAVGVAQGVKVEGELRGASPE
jgi:hypothetical protein